MKITPGSCWVADSRVPCVCVVLWDRKITGEFNKHLPEHTILNDSGKFVRSRFFYLDRRYVIWNKKR